MNRNDSDIDSDKKSISSIRKSDIKLIFDILNIDLDKHNYKDVMGLLNNYIVIKKRAISINEACDVVDECLNKQ